MQDLQVHILLTTYVSYPILDQLKNSSCENVLKGM